MRSRSITLLTVAALLMLSLTPALEAVGTTQEEFAFAAADSEAVVYVTKTGEKYHRESCRYLSRSKIKTTLVEAKRRGYTPCKVCKPPS